MSHFLCVWLQSWKKYQYGLTKFFYEKKVSKNTEMHADFKSVVRQTWFPYNLFWCIFLKLFQRIWNQHEILCFLITSLIKKNFFGHISTFFKLWSQTRKKRRKNQKILYSKCFLDLNFAPIKGSVFLIFKKSQIRCTLLYKLIQFSMRLSFKNTVISPWVLL